MRTPYLIGNCNFGIYEGKIAAKIGIKSAIILESLHGLMKKGELSCRVSVKWISEHRQIPERTVWFHIRKLENLGLIVRKNLDKFVRGSINTYEICMDKISCLLGSKPKVKQSSPTCDKNVIYATFAQQDLHTLYDKELKDKEEEERKERRSGVGGFSMGLFLSSFSKTFGFSQTAKQPGVERAGVYTLDAESSLKAKQPNSQFPSLQGGESFDRPAVTKGVLVMTETWNTTVAEVGLSTLMIEPQDLTDKSIEHAKLAWDALGEESWRQALDMYKKSAYLQGKSSANGFAPFLFAAVIDPRRLPNILRGQYTGGIDVGSVSGGEEVQKVAVFEDLDFGEGYIDEKKQLAVRMGPAAYESWIAKGAVQFSKSKDTLYLTCAPYVFDRLEVLYINQLLSIFGVKFLERKEN